MAISSGPTLAPSQATRLSPLELRASAVTPSFNFTSHSFNGAGEEELEDDDVEQLNHLLRKVLSLQQEQLEQSLGSVRVLLIKQLNRKRLGGRGGASEMPKENTHSEFPPLEQKSVAPKVVNFSVLEESAQESNTTARMTNTVTKSTETAGGTPKFAITPSVHAKRTHMLESFTTMNAGRRSVLKKVAGIDSEDMERFVATWSKKHSCLKCFRYIVSSSTFSALVVLAILLNAIFIAVGAETDLSISIRGFEQGRPNDAHAPEWFGTANVFFVSYFGIELLLRIFALEGDFLIGPEWRWNILDTILFCISVVEIFLVSADIHVSYIKLLRLMKMVRSVRLIRVLRFFRPLKLLLLSVLNSLMPLIWTIVFLFLTLFVFAIIAMQGVTDYLTDAAVGDMDGELMLEFFGNLPTVLLSHLMAVTGGISWYELSKLLKLCSTAHLSVFVFYILVMLLMVLNIVTGIFVNDAIQTAQSDRDFLMQAKIDSDTAKCAELKRLFTQLDADHSGKITLEEFQELIKVPRVRLTFGSMGLEVSDAAGFFRLLDIDGSTELEIDEFVVGCMHLARPLSADLLMSENKRMINRLMQVNRRLSKDIILIVESVNAIKNKMEYWPRV